MSLTEKTVPQTSPDGESKRPSGRDRWPLAGIGFGGDYNPEQWPEETWVEDVALMREAGVTFVSLGVFSWALLEPREGEFDFGWLDRVVQLLHQGGIAIDLATATASPPPWLSRRYPETLPVDRDGRLFSPGSRQAFCPSSPVFRERALSLVEQLATRYGRHPAVAMWHVSNELGCHVARCYCDVSADSFRSWLSTRYADVGELNERWGTRFWSQSYGEWEEILPPRLTPAHRNPTQWLDWCRFSSDELLSYFVAERDLLHRLAPDLPVTTNFMVMPDFEPLDYFRWAKEQDLVSQDHYLNHQIDDPVPELAFSADLTRGVAGGKPWFLMEHSTSAVNWQPVNHAKAPGELIRNSLTHVARGADAVGFFQWRASRAGAEKWHSALVPHTGTDSKIWRDVTRLGGVLSRAADVAGTTVDAEVAVLFDYQSRWALDQPSHPTDRVPAIEVPRAVHRAFWDAGVVSDVVHPHSDLSRYRVVVVPTLYLCDDATAATLRAYVERGGHVVVSYLSGLVDEHDHVRLGGYPGAFRDLLGVRTEEFFPLLDGERVTATGASATLGDLSIDRWTELTRLVTAQVVAGYTDGPCAGNPAITRRDDRSGGSAWYVAAGLDDDGWCALLGEVSRLAGVTGMPGGGGGVEVVRRSGADRAFLFVINHTAGEVAVPARGFDLVSGEPVDGRVSVPAGGCAVVREA